MELIVLCWWNHRSEYVDLFIETGVLYNVTSVVIVLKELSALFSYNYNLITVLFYLRDSCMCIGVLVKKSELKQKKEFPFHLVNKHILTSDILIIWHITLLGRGKSEWEGKCCIVAMIVRASLAKGYEWEPNTQYYQYKMKVFMMPRPYCQAWLDVAGNL